MDDRPARARTRWWRVLMRWGHEALYLAGMAIGFTVPEPPSGRRDPPLPRNTRLAAELRTHLASAPDVEIETRRSPTAPAFRTAIRVVMDDDGRVYARSALGTSAYWYRRVLINPGVTLHTGNGSVYVRAVRQQDGRVATHVSELYRLKYGSDDRGTLEWLGPDPERATVRFELF